MLQRADAELVARDQALPALELLLDPERLHAAIVAAARSVEVRQPLIEYLRYKPGQSCLATGRLTAAGREIWFSAKAYRPDATDKLKKYLGRPAVPGPLGGGRLALGSGVVLSVFPNDRELTTLAGLDPAGLYARLVRENPLAHWTPGRNARVGILRYNPERRFVGCLHADDRKVAAVRCYGPSDFERVAEKANALVSRGSLRLACTLMRLPRQRLLALEWLEGTLLDDILCHQHHAAHETMGAVGSALAELHRQDGAGLPGRVRRSSVSALCALANDIGWLCPGLADQARSLVERLAARLSVARHAMRPLHGDLHARQVLVQNDAIALLDLDEAHRGDPAWDLGRLGADLERAALYREIDEERAHASFDAVLEGYRRTAGALPPHLNLKLAVHLVGLAPHPFRRRETNWPERMASVLARAETFLDADLRSAQPRVQAGAPALVPEPSSRTRGSAVSPGATGTQAAPPVVEDPFGAARDARMPFLNAALSPATMSKLFSRALQEACACRRADVRRISVIRYKPGRRSVIEYVLEAAGPGPGRREITLIGKCRARSADVATHELLRHLSNELFGPQAEDGVLVPHPVCVLPALHMTVQQRVPGSSCWTFLARPDGVSMARRAAEAIEKLHRVSPPATRRHSADDEIAILHERLEAVAETRPDWRRRIEAVFAACCRQRQHLDGSSRCGIHRDFYPDQLLSDGERVWLLDLDLYSEGDAALDVGNFAAHLDEYALRRFGSAECWAHLKRAFIDRYLELSVHTTRRAVDAYANLTLARHVAISLQFPDRQPFTDSLLQLCEDRLLRASLSK